MLNKFDQFTKIENFQGRNYSEIPYGVRVALYSQLTPEEHKQFELGRADAEVIKKAQAIYDNFYKEVNPTEETLLKRSVENQSNIEFQTLNIQLKNKKERLARLDHDAELDIPLPIGARKQLRAEIAQLERQLNIQKTFKEDSTDSTESDWLDGFFTE
jgi:hypothetical protein